MRTPPRRIALVVTAALAATIFATPGAAAPRRPRTIYGTATFHITREDNEGTDVLDPTGAGGRTALVGDFTGSASTPAGRLDDIFWYTPGPGGDELWRTNGDRSWAATTETVNGTYTPLVGRFSADHKDDIFWYAPGSTIDYLWDFNDDGTITKKAMPVSGTYTPIVGRFTADGVEDILWYAPGKAADSWWDFNPDGTVTRRALTVNGTFIPVVGSFAGDASITGTDVQDVLWYAPGTAADSLWDFRADGTIARHALTINGRYTPIAGNFSGDGHDDVLWYAPGTAPDSLWNFTSSSGAKTVVPETITGSYTPLAATVFDEGSGLTDIVWFGTGARRDALWDYTAPGVRVDRPITLTGDTTPVLGAFEDVGPDARTGADIVDLHS